MSQPILLYLSLIRAPAMFTAMSNILAAHLILTQGQIQPSSLLLLMGSSAFLYSAGMALNDWFDYELDLQQRPGRPLPSGQLSRRHALLFAGVLMICAVVFAALVGTLSLYIALMIVLLVILYDGLLKRTAFGSLGMAGCRYANWLLGFSFLPLTGVSLSIPVPVFLYIMAVTLLSQQEEYAANRKAVVSVAVLILLSGESMLAIALLNEVELGWMALPVLTGSAYLLYRLWQTYHDFTTRNIQAMMQLLILAIIPLDALLVMLFAPPGWALLVLALLLPGKWLARFMYVT